MTPITYNKIIKRLTKLGFVSHEAELGLILRHSETDTVLIIPKGLEERGSEHFMKNMKHHLVSKGLMNENTFNDVMYRSPTATTNSKLQKVINRAENFVHLYQKAADKNRITHLEYKAKVKTFTEALLADGRVTKEELLNYFPHQR
jgi:hypothetical protein